MRPKRQAIEISILCGYGEEKILADKLESRYGLQLVEYMHTVKDSPNFHTLVFVPKSIAIDKFSNLLSFVDGFKAGLRS